MNFRQVTICAAAALLAAAAGCRAHAPACNLPFEMPQVARPAIPSNAVSVADCGGSGGGDAGTGYAMTLSVTAGVLSPNITGLPTSWAAGVCTWTATDVTGAARSPEGVA